MLSLRVKGSYNALYDIVTTLLFLFPFSFRNFCKPLLYIVFADVLEYTTGNIDWLRISTNNGVHYPVSVCGFALQKSKFNV